VYLVVQIPLIRKIGALGYQHKPYAVFFMGEKPVALFHLERNLSLKNTLLLTEVKYLDLNRAVKVSEIIVPCGLKPSKSKRFNLVYRKFGKAVPVPEHLIKTTFPLKVYEKKELDFAYRTLKTYLLLKRDSELFIRKKIVAVKYKPRKGKTKYHIYVKGKGLIKVTQKPVQPYCTNYPYREPDHICIQGTLKTIAKQYWNTLETLHKYTTKTITQIQ